MNPLIRTIRPTDVDEWVRLRDGLWPEADPPHEQEIREWLETRHREETVLVLDLGLGRLGGIIEVRIRDYAEGCSSERIGYIEGWYVEDRLRRQGWGAKLVAAAEKWARRQGCEEMASDTELANTLSQQAHLSLGYQEVERLVCFRKSLSLDEGAKG